MNLAPKTENPKQVMGCLHPNPFISDLRLFWSIIFLLSWLILSYLTIAGVSEELVIPTARGHVSFVAETNLPTRKGVYRVRAYKDYSRKDRESEIIVMADGEVV